MEYLGVLGFFMAGFAVPEFSGSNQPLFANLWCGVASALISASFLIN